MLSLAPVVFNLGLTTPPHVSQSVAPCSLSKTAWKDPMASKPAGDSSAMPSASEQELLCTSQTSEAAGTDNGKGLVASGPVSFGKIYSCLNEQLRRGGVYKNGAVVLHLDISHPDMLEFVETPRQEIPWAKRCINLTAELWELQADENVQNAILKGIARGDIWLAKIRLTNMVAVSMPTSAWRSSSVAVAPACWNTSTWVLVA